MKSETTTLEEPANADGEIDIMKIAMEADANLAANAPQDNPQPEGKPTDKSAKPADAGKPGEKGKDKNAKPADAGKPGEKGKDDKPDPEPAKGSKFEQARKEQERRDRSWQALEKEKQEFRAEKGALLAQVQGLQREVAEMRKKPASTGPARDSHGATASDYDELAKRYKDEGNDEMAKAAAERAEALRKQTPQAEPPAGESHQQPEFQAEWQKHVQELVQATPELADPENPLVKATNTLISHPTYGRFFRAAPDGIKAAYEVACLMRDAHTAGESKKQLAAAQEELKTARSEIERLNGLLQPRGSHPAAPNSGSERELTDADVHRIAAAADRGELN